MKLRPRDLTTLYLPTRTVRVRQGGNSAEFEMGRAGEAHTIVLWFLGPSFGLTDEEVFDELDRIMREKGVAL